MEEQFLGSLCDGGERGVSYRDHAWRDGVYDLEGWGGLRSCEWAEASGCLYEVDWRRLSSKRFLTGREELSRSIRGYLVVGSGVQCDSTKVSCSALKVGANYEHEAKKRTSGIEAADAEYSPHFYTVGRLCPCAPISNYYTCHEHGMPYSRLFLAATINFSMIPAHFFALFKSPSSKLSTSPGKVAPE